MRSYQVLSLFFPAHRVWRSGWWAVPYVPWKLPRRLQISTVHWMPGSAGNVSIFC